ncbi:MAG: nitroreductase family deazaflavin-dependent oxidoreductase [Polyangiaceae bacterium]|jgi:F420H(2)-dependent quinone reductase
MNPIQKAFIATHVFLFRSTGGKMGSSMGGQKVVLLTTKGNKSGKERTVPLMVFEDGGSSFLIASAGGSPANPAWFKNIQGDPNVTIEEKGRRFTARAEVVTGEQRTRIWDLVTRTQPRFTEYKKNAQGREIPVVLLKEA